MRRRVQEASYRRLGCAVLACLLGACATTVPLSERLPVDVAGVHARAAGPALPPVPARGIYEQVQALLAREKLHAAHARQLEALLDACAGR